MPNSGFYWEISIRILQLSLSVHFSAESWNFLTWVLAAREDVGTKPRVQRLTLISLLATFCPLFSSPIPFGADLLDWEAEPLMVSVALLPSDTLAGYHPA
jgi:hypothetical protein